MLCAHQGSAVTVSAAHHCGVAPALLPWGNNWAQRAAVHGITSGCWCSVLRPKSDVFINDVDTPKEVLVILNQEETLSPLRVEGP